MDARAIELTTHSSIRDVGRDRWLTLTRDAPPHLGFEWLDALEQSGAVRPERGWLPIHLTLHHAGRLIAGAPAYVKGNSEGEFVFDHSWARFAEARLNVDYYPKLVVAVPFTPATGPRLLVAPGVDRVEAAQAFSQGLVQLCDRAGLSGAHVLFPRADESDELEAAGLMRRHGIQFHWRNRGYESFADFLSCFNSKRRNQIRRERSKLSSEGVEIRTYTGDTITSEAVDLSFEFYKSTVDKYFWGRQYLNREFFQLVAQTMPERLHLVIAWQGSRPLGGAVNLLGPRRLYGRYWGAWQQRQFLHFEVCYYHGIEQCIERGLEVFEPGAGGEHKHSRGFEPTITHSLHYLADPRLHAAVADFCQHEREVIDQHLESARQRPVLKPER